MEAEGYKYVRMDYYPRDFHNEYVTIWFTKSTSVIDLAKSFRFSLKNNDIHNSWESIYFDDGFYYSDDENINSRETKRLKKKIKEIEKEYKGKYEDAYGLKLSFGWKTYYYDLETKDLKKESNLLKLKQYPKEQLFTITGNSINRFKKGTKIKLVKESDNKIDYNHLAVYLDDNKIGYVSRGGYGVSGASELNISDYAYGEYLTLAVNENRLYPVFRLIKTQPKKTPYQIKRLKEETNPILKKCNEYKKAKQYTEADKCYDELIKINPTVKNYEDKAANLINMKKYEEAQKCLNKAKSISNFPNSTSIQAIQKTINEKQLKQDKVTEISTISKDNEKSEQNKIKNFKEEKIQLLKKCNEYKKAKQYTEADKCYDELIKINPTVKNYEDKAANLINMEKYEEAQESLNKAKSLSKFPNSTSIQAIQKIITNKQGKTTETPQKEEEHKKKTYKQITLFDC